MNTLIFLFLLGFAQPTPAMADTISHIDLSYSTTSAPEIITAYAVHYGIPAEPLIKTLKCESGFDASAVGDHGHSIGVAQISVIYHPEISKQQSLDPFFSIDFTASQFAQGHQSQWTCFRNLYGRAR